MASAAPDWPGIGAAVGASVLVVAPWVVYNMTRFDEPMFLSTNDGLALAGSNCDPVYSRRAVPG